MRLDTNSMRDAGLASRMDIFDPRARLLCALLLTAAVGTARSLASLALAAGSAVALLVTGGFGGIASGLRSVNIFVLFLWLTLPFTGGGTKSYGFLSNDGIALALLCTLRVNIAAILAIRLATSMDLASLSAALEGFGCPARLKTLLLLSFRSVMTLAGSMRRMFLALGLRAPGLHGRESWRAYACVMGSSLVRSADRAERVRLALLCRGGENGFSGERPGAWDMKDSALAAAAAALSAAILLL